MSSGPDITERARRWLREAFDHPLWKDHVREADALGDLIDEIDRRQAEGVN